MAVVDDLVFVYVLGLSVAADCLFPGDVEVGLHKAEIADRNQLVGGLVAHISWPMQLTGHANGSG